MVDPAFGIRPLMVGAGVISGMLVVLFDMIEAIMDDVSTVEAGADAAKVALDVAELLVELVTPTATERRIATSTPGTDTREFADVFRKQSSDPLTALG